MKKSLLFLPELVSGIMLIATISSCSGIDFSGSKNTNLTAPSCTVTKTGVVISPFAVSNIEYINIFRDEYTSDSDDASITDGTKTYHVCQLVPETSSTQPLQMTFVDKYVDSSKYYRYWIRYKLSSGYVNSNDSPTLSAENCTDTSIIGEQELTYSTAATLDELKIKWDTSTCQMTMSLNVFKLKASETDDSPKAFNIYTIDSVRYLSTEASTKGSTFSDTEWDYDEAFTLCVIVYNTGTKETYLFPIDPSGTEDLSIGFRSVLPDSFYNQNLKIKGFIAQTKLEGGKGTNNSSTKTYNIYRWTKPLYMENASDLKLIDINDTSNNSDGEEIEQFEVTEVHTSNIYGDYSDPASKRISSAPINAKDAGLVFNWDEE